MRNKKKMDNNGFSLVELIIVIAIMAVLIGVLAPQYLKYVERGRESADLDNIDVMISAVEIYNADPAHSPVSGTIVASSTGEITVANTVQPAFQDAGLPVNPAAMKSAKYKDWTITVGPSGVTFSGTNGATLQSALGRAAVVTPAPGP